MKFTLPLTIDEIKKVLDNTNPISIEVDLANSKLKGKSALVYLSNLELGNIRLILEGLSFEEKKSFLIEYIKLKNILRIEQLLSTNFYVIMQQRGQDIGIDQSELESESILNKDEVEKILQDQEYVSALENMKEVLEAIPFFMVSTLNAFRKSFDSFLEECEVIDDPTFTGFTFVNYLQFPIFQFHFYSQHIMDTNKKFKYFKTYFDDYIYKGESLGSYLMKPGNVMLPMMNMVINGEFTPEHYNILASETENDPSL